MKDRTIPRVSDVLRLIDDSYKDVPEELLALAADRGRKLHEFVLSYFSSLLGHWPGLRIEEIPNEYRACYEGALEWAINNEVKPILVEERSINTVLGYSGQPDLFAYKGQKQIKTLFDLKFTSTILPMNRVQLRAYKELPLYADAVDLEIVKVNWKTGEVKSERIYENGTGSWGAFMLGLTKLRLLEQVQELDEELAVWRG